MAQYDFGTIDPNTTSGAELASMLTLMNQAHTTMHMGPGQPAYLRPGTVWFHEPTPGARNCAIYLWDGDANVLMFGVDRVLNVISVPYADRAGTATAIPPGRIVGLGSVFTGGPQDWSVDRGIRLINDIPPESRPANHYYGTNGNGDRGWFGLPSGGGAATAGNYPHILIYGPGNHSVTVPANVNGCEFIAYAAGGGNFAGYYTHTDYYYGGENGTEVIGANSYQVNWGWPGGRPGAAWGNMTVAPGEVLRIDVENNGASRYYAERRPDDNSLEWSNAGGVAHIHGRIHVTGGQGRGPNGAGGGDGSFGLGANINANGSCIPVLRDTPYVYTGWEQTGGRVIIRWWT